MRVSGERALRAGDGAEYLTSVLNDQSRLVRQGRRCAALPRGKDLERVQQRAEDRAQVERMEGPLPSGASEQGAPRRHDAALDLLSDVLGEAAPGLRHDALAPSRARAALFHE